MPQSIFTYKAPKAVGPYSQAIVANGFVFCSGSIGINPVTGTLDGDTIETQTKQIFKNITHVLKEAGSSLEKVVQTNCFLTNMDNYKTFNEIYATFFTTNKPARTTVSVSQLPAGAIVEIAVTAQL